jgi:hypothetical protein
MKIKSAESDLGQKTAPQDAPAVYQDLIHARLSRLAAVFDWTAVASSTPGFEVSPQRCESSKSKIGER